MGETQDQRELRSPLLPTQDNQSETTRTGTLCCAVAHIITAVIGSGVLSLPWSVAQLGWVAGPLSMLLFAAVTLTASLLLCNSYLYPDPQLGPFRNRSFLDAVRVNLGKRSERVCAVFLKISIYGTGIAYTVTSATSMRAVQKSNCYHKQGHEAKCTYGDTTYMLLFGLLQILLSQAPDFHNIQWMSIIAAVMSFAYSSIGLGLGLAKTIENGFVKGTIAGVATSTPTDKLWLVAQALGDIAFAYPFSVVLLNIQDTLKAPPPQNQTMMKKASIIAIAITTFFYLCCGCFGYAAFGDATPGNLLTGFGFYEPYWLIDFANVCIVIHLLGGYQLFSQLMFANIERWLVGKFPESRLIKRGYTVEIPLFPTLNLSLLRMCFRTSYVMSTTGIAMFFPYFNQVIAVKGSMTFWTLIICFPVEMYIVQKKIEAWTTKWILLRTFSIACFMVTIFAFVGSVQGLIKAKLG